MRWSLVARALALCIFTTACDGGAGPEPGATGAPPPSTIPVAAQGPAPVVVTNGADSPVPTMAVGTTAVTGAVEATQRGAWSVHVDNASVAVEGTVAVSGGAIAASQAGPWSVAVDGAVALAPGASVAVSALPPVSIAGTPQVALAGTPAVTVANTPAVTIAGAAQAVPVTGGVAVTNLPAVQEVSGTVAIEPRDAVWGNLVLTDYQSGGLPVGLTLTDLTISALDPGDHCIVQLYVQNDQGLITQNGGVWLLNSYHPAADIHLQTGITASAPAPGTAHFTVRNAETCTLSVLWSGYMP